MTVENRPLESQARGIADDTSLIGRNVLSPTPISDVDYAIQSYTIERLCNMVMPTNRCFPISDQMQQHLDDLFDEDYVVVVMVSMEGEFHMDGVFGLFNRKDAEQWANEKARTMQIEGVQMFFFVTALKDLTP